MQLAQGAAVCVRQLSEKQWDLWHRLDFRTGEVAEIRDNTFLYRPCRKDRKAKKYIQHSQTMQDTGGSGDCRLAVFGTAFSGSQCWCSNEKHSRTFSLGAYLLPGCTNPLHRFALILWLTFCR